MDGGLTKQEAKRLFSPEARGKKTAKLETSQQTVSARVRTASLAILDQYALDEFAEVEGHHQAEAGNWGAAAAAFGRACDMAPDVFQHWYLRGLCELKAQHQEACLAVCRRMIDRFNTDRNLSVRIRALELCLIVRSLPADELGAIAEHVSPRYLRGRWSGPTGALLAIRNGYHATAEQLLHDRPAVEYHALGWYYVRALVLAILGHGGADKSFADAERLFARMSLHWPSRVYHEFLRDEAREAIERYLGDDPAKSGNVKEFRVDTSDSRQ
jgi:hypothetical protein